MTSSAYLHFITLAAGTLGGLIALRTAWGISIGKREKTWSPVQLPEGAHFLLFLCAAIAVLTRHYDTAVLEAQFASGLAPTAHTALIVLACVNLVWGGHTFIGEPYIYGKK